MYFQLRVRFRERIAFEYVLENFKEVRLCKFSDLDEYGSCIVELGNDRNVLERFLQLCRSKLNNGSIARAIRIDEIFEEHDLEGYLLCELISLSDASFYVENREECYAVERCATCHFPKFTQISDLSVRSEGLGSEKIVIGTHWEILVHVDLQDLLANYGVQTRSIRRLDGFRQIICGEVYLIDEPPIEFSSICSRCSMGKVARPYLKEGPELHVDSCELTVITPCLPITLSSKGCALSDLAVLSLRQSLCVLDVAKMTDGECLEDAGVCHKPIFFGAKLAQEIRNMNLKEVRFIPAIFRDY